MEYVYAAMLLHSAGKKINEDSVKKVLDATGAKADDARVKALVASLKDVSIEDAISKAAAAPVAAAPAAGGAERAAAKGEKKEEKKSEEEEKKTEEEAASGLSSLFG